MLIDAETAFDKIQHSLMIETLTKQEIEKNFLNFTKIIYEKSKANTLNGKRLKTFPLRSTQRCLVSSLLFNILYSSQGN